MIYYANYEKASGVCLFECLTDTDIDRLVRRINSKARQAASPCHRYHWSVWGEDGKIVVEGDDDYTDADGRCSDCSYLEKCRELDEQNPNDPACIMYDRKEVEP